MDPPADKKPEPALGKPHPSRRTRTASAFRRRRGDCRVHRERACQVSRKLSPRLGRVNPGSIEMPTSDPGRLSQLRGPPKNYRSMFYNKRFDIVIQFRMELVTGCVEGRDFRVGDHFMPLA